jgi:cytochrome subunit of sulfide dehydrogenase
MTPIHAAVYWRVEILVLLIWLPAVQADDAPPAVTLCAQCHGVAGPSPFPGVPTIHGLPPGVIENALYDFREELRPCRKSECSADGRCPDMSMCDITAEMSKEEMDRLAHWYAAKPFPHHQDPYDPELAAKGRALHDRHCEICHTNSGSDPLDDASMLRGQRKDYLRRALEDFQHGHRLALDAMDERLRELSDDELDALAEFYAGPAADPLPGD